ncbi:hypothetical protein CYMTET_41227 [Cymbomonas tetramitiformis]|uniref:Sulfatase N-terminal domain-containing protein n=1 Tax=Cymbomonas tetramitiformis TaxID=36881 RepID=A0AAE0F2Q5_9CHLO|nr:hypothetical protein CYMTET_41227 [Cymbomonas tetramitiformis]
MIPESGCTFVLSLMIALSGVGALEYDKRLNVAVFIVDDLRPEITTRYGQKQVITPNIDKLISESMVFERAYCQQATCSPSRNSFLSGRRPHKTKTWNFINHFREVGPDWVSFSQYFKEHNYTTLGVGKTYHGQKPPNEDQPLSWSEDREYFDKGGKTKKCYMDFPGKDTSIVCPDKAKHLSHFTDYANLEVMLENLRYANARDSPFFLVYGIHKPHLPFHMPKEFWDEYPPTEEIDLPEHGHSPRDAPWLAHTYAMDGQREIDVFGQTYKVPHPHSWNKPFPDNITRTLRKGYYASVSFVDFLVGEVLGELDTLGRTNDTLVVLFGDHGWQLGEHGEWAKQTNFELATRVPLVFKVPGRAAGSTDALVELVDVYPTVAALAGLDAPVDLDGEDLSPHWNESASPRRKEAAFSEFPRCPANLTRPIQGNVPCSFTNREEFKAIGYSVRTEDWRYTVWLPWNATTLRGNFDSEPLGLELYSHIGDDGVDFNLFENVNKANDSDYSDLLDTMHELAKNHWDSDGIIPSELPSPQPVKIVDSPNL